MLDIDDFKRINDIYGHAVGDRILGELADHLRASVRGANVVCRIGGEEFAVIALSAEPASTSPSPRVSQSVSRRPTSSSPGASPCRSASRTAPSTR